jgi:hypothetical protein
MTTQLISVATMSSMSWLALLSCFLARSRNSTAMFSHAVFWEATRLCSILFDVPHTVARKCMYAGQETFANDFQFRLYAACWAMVR